MTDPHRVAVLMLPEAVALDIAIPLEVFERARRLGWPYDIRLVGRAAAAGPFGRWSPTEPLEWAELAHTVIVPGRYDESASVREAVLEIVRRSHERGARLASLCGGAFLLAQAGVLDGLTATTHWNLCRDLERMYPLVTVDERSLYVDAGQVLTSAGLAAGLDLCIHMIRTDHGVRAGNRVARSMVFAPHRSGGQAQFVDQFPPASADGGELREWISAHLEEPLTLADMATQANMSTRTLLRRFRTQTGQSPQQWLTAQRVRRARELLEATAEPVELIARKSGFGSAATMRLHFRREVGMSPQSYRRAYA